MSRPHWLIYALGGGLGHVTRATSLIRAADRAGVSCTLLANTSLLTTLPLHDELPSSARLIALPPDVSPPEVAARLRAELSIQPPDCLIVDTFPRGLGGELADVLPDLSCRKVLIHRDLNPRYVQQFDLRSFVSHYDLILVPGEEPELADVAQAVRTRAWLCRDADELFSPDEARRRLLLTTVTSLPIVLVSASGHASEMQEMCDIADQLDRELRGQCIVRLACLIEPTNEDARLLRLSDWPLLPLLPGVAVLVGSGGYNTVQEARAVGVPFVGLARTRLYDRQAHRLTDSELVPSTEAIKDRVRELLARPRSIEPIGYENGVHQAVRVLLELGQIRHS